jgi:predicted Kef-type K+ transport protein
MTSTEVHATTTRIDWPLITALVVSVALALIAGIIANRLGLDTGYYPDF